MIVTFYSTKGGCGKTSSALALLSAIAEKNHSSSLAEKIRVAAVDVDPQGSLSNFARERAARGLPSHGISHYSKQASTDAADEIKELARENDLLIVDTQGAYSGANVQIIGVSDVVLVPSGLEAMEAVVTSEVLNYVLSLAETGRFNGSVAMLMTRTPAAAGFLSKLNLAVLSSLRANGYPVLATAVNARPAIPNIVNTSLFLFEQAAKEPKSKSIPAAQEDARRLLSFVLDWTLLPALTEAVVEGGTN